MLEIGSGNVLLQAGADINALGGVDANALTVAIIRNHREVVEVLLRAGAVPVEENEGRS